MTYFWDILWWAVLASFSIVILLSPVALIFMLRKQRKAEQAEVANGIHRNNIAIQVTGFILGVISILFSWTGAALFLLSAALGIIFSAFGLKRTNLRGLSITGLILSILGASVTLLITLASRSLL